MCLNNINMDVAPLSNTLVKEKQFLLQSDNKQYKIKISVLSDIILEINQDEKIGTYYTNKFSLENLTKLSKCFRICDNIEEAYDIIVSNIETKKASVIILNKNEITLVLKIELPGGKLEETKLNLHKKEIDKDKLIEELINKINQLEEKQKEFENLFEDEIKIKRMLKKIKFDTKIINNEDETQFIINEIINKYPDLKENQNLFKSTLLYRATRDGDNHDCFYKKVENIRKTLTLIKTTKGVRFGCFLEIEIKKKGGESKDDKCFVFSVDMKKVYNIIPGSYCLNNGDSEVLNLYNQPFYIKNNFLSNNNSYTAISSRLSQNLLGFKNDYELNNYEKNFRVEEMETFQIK